MVLHRLFFKIETLQATSNLAARSITQGESSFSLNAGAAALLIGLVRLMSWLNAEELNRASEGFGGLL